MLYGHSVLFGNDVVRLEGKYGEVLRQLTVLTPVPSSLGHLPFERLWYGHHEPGLDCFRARRALECIMSMRFPRCK